ncbi:S-layer homology domain-containing protein [Tissierella carlieri]|uniref:S-layer homology domain-containing protein n=1 Tax=Tissierella carlieri TaxID=689904 RepID=UPI001C11C556|nr:S-layer homology domain-containing protein [Tissierella carlieri]MBU5313146.1 S-layer homology domain-containing protein [Tissierella carlieri]
MKRTLSILLIIILLLPSFSFANPYEELTQNIRVFQMGIMGQGSIDLDKKISREELATIAVRLKGLEYLKDFQKQSTPFKDVKGWSVPYINIAYDMKLVNAVKKDFFNPNGKVSYGELLTVLMRVLGYENGVDFKKYPEDYYSKALEIGLGNLYIPHDEVVTRGIAATTINKALDLKMKNSDKELSSLQLNYYIDGNVTKKDSVVESEVYLKELSFSTTILGVFSGVLVGVNDFSRYKVVLLSKSGKVLDSKVLGINGSFSIENFDISTLSKLQGYKYEIYSPNGSLILWDDLD